MESLAAQRVSSGSSAEEVLAATKRKLQARPAFNKIVISKGPLRLETAGGRRLLPHGGFLFAQLHRSGRVKITAFLINE